MGNIEFIKSGATIVMGIILIILGVIIILIKSNKNKKYDERQMLMRGKCYKYAFFAFMFYSFLDFLLETFELTKIAAPEVWTVQGILVAIAVLMGTAIWNDAYFPLGDYKVRIMVTIGIVIIANAFSLAVNLMHGSFMVDGQLQLSVLNAEMIIIFVVILIEIIIKGALDKKEGEEDEES